MLQPAFGDRDSLCSLAPFAHSLSLSQNFSACNYTHMEEKHVCRCVYIGASDLPRVCSLTASLADHRITLLLVGWLHYMLLVKILVCVVVVILIQVVVMVLLVAMNDDGNGD